MKWIPVTILLLAYLAVVGVIGWVLWSKGHEAWAVIVALILVTGLKIHVSDEQRV